MVMTLVNASCDEEAPIVPLEEPRVTTTTIVTGYEIIWGMDFLPDGDLLFGRNRVSSTGSIMRQSPK